MGIRRGSITTDIIADGLVLNMDAANRASYPAQRTLATAESGSCYNTLDTTQSGSFIGDPTFVTQPISASSWVFDGVDDHISFLQTSGQYTQDPCSFEFWVKLDNESSTYPIVVDFVDGGGIQIYVNGNKWRIRGEGNATTVASNASVSFGTWYQIVATYAGTELKFYINGQLDKADTWADGVITSTKTMYIGVYRDGDQYEWEGNIANMHIYHKVLSASEVLHNYNALKGRFA